MTTRRHSWRDSPELVLFHADVGHRLAGKKRFGIPGGMNAQGSR